MEELKGSDVLSDATKAALNTRLVFEPFSDTRVHCQIATFMDAVDGSTARGTSRELCQMCLCLHNSDAQLGYNCALTQEALQVKDAEAPSEQTSNLSLCKHDWVDDFQTSKPFYTAVLRQLSGSSTITAARKNGRVKAFKFKGKLFLVTNCRWTAVVPVVGADVPQITGFTFDVRFVDEPVGQSEMAKDSLMKVQMAAISHGFGLWPWSSD